MTATLGESSSLVFWSVTLAIGVITFLLRYIPIALLSRFQLPRWLKHALIFVPPAVLTAIITPALFFPGATPTISIDTPRLVAAALAALVAWRTGSVLWTVSLGMCALWGVEALVR